MSRDSYSQDCVFVDDRKMVLEFIIFFLSSYKGHPYFDRYFPCFEIKDLYKLDQLSHILLYPVIELNPQKDNPEYISKLHLKGYPANVCMFYALRPIFAGVDIDVFIRTALPVLVASLAVEAVVAILCAKALLSDFEAVSFLVNARDLDGNTILHQAVLAIDRCAYQGQPDYFQRAQVMLGILKQFGACYETKNRQRKTPEMLLWGGGVFTVDEGWKPLLAQSIRQVLNVQVELETWKIERARQQEELDDVFLPSLSSFASASTVSLASSSAPMNIFSSLSAAPRPSLAEPGATARGGLFSTSALTSALENITQANVNADAGVDADADVCCLRASTS